MQKLSAQQTETMLDLALSTKLNLNTRAAPRRMLLNSISQKIIYRISGHCACLYPFHSFYGFLEQCYVLWSWLLSKLYTCFPKMNLVCYFEIKTDIMKCKVIFFCYLLPFFRKILPLGFLSIVCECIFFFKFSSELYLQLTLTFVCKGIGFL